MADPRAVLDVIRQRADRYTHHATCPCDPDRDPYVGCACGETRREDLRRDNRRLVAALTAALDLADGPYARWVEAGPEGGPAMIPAATLLAVIEAALTEEGA